MAGEPTVSSFVFWDLDDGSSLGDSLTLNWSTTVTFAIHLVSKHTEDVDKTTLSIVDSTKKTVLGTFYTTQDNDCNVTTSAIKLSKYITTDPTTSTVYYIRAYFDVYDDGYDDLYKYITLIVRPSATKSLPPTNIEITNFTYDSDYIHHVPFNVPVTLIWDPATPGKIGTTECTIIGYYIYVYNVNQDTFLDKKTKFISATNTTTVNGATKIVGQINSLSVEEGKYQYYVSTVCGDSVCNSDKDNGLTTIVCHAPVFNSLATPTLSQTNKQSAIITGTSQAVFDYTPGQGFELEYELSIHQLNNNTYCYTTTSTINTTILEEDIAKCPITISDSNNVTMIVYVYPYYKYGNATYGKPSTSVWGATFQYFPTVNPPANVTLSPISGDSDQTFTVTWEDAATGNGQIPSELYLIIDDTIFNETNIYNSDNTYSFIMSDLVSGNSIHTVQLMYKFYDHYSSLSNQAVYSGVGGNIHLYHSGWLTGHKIYRYETDHWVECKLHYYDATTKKWIKI